MNKDSRHACIKGVVYIQLLILSIPENFCHTERIGPKSYTCNASEAEGHSRVLLRVCTGS